MTLQELKNQIRSDTLNVTILVWQCEDASGEFVANQYLDLICSNCGLSKSYINKLSDASDYSSLSLVDTSESKLKIYKTETLSVQNVDWYSFTNTIVICNKIDKKVQASVDEYLVKFPKLVAWQIEDYVKLRVPELDPKLITELVKLSSNNIYRVENEIKKIELFPEEANKVLQEIIYEKDSDFYSLSTFTFVDALIKKDMLIIHSAFEHLGQWDSDPMFILTLLMNKYKQICLIHGNPRITAEEMSLTPKQFNAIKFYYKGFNLEDIRKKIKFLSSINLRLTRGRIGFESPKYFLTYIVNNLLI